MLNWTLRGKQMPTEKPLRWDEFTNEQLASEANDIAASLVGVPEEARNEFLLLMHERVASTLSVHLGRRLASTVAGAFVRLVKRQRSEFESLGFVDYGDRLQ
jgi:hypothetical protein